MSTPARDPRAPLAGGLIQTLGLLVLAFSLPLGLLLLGAGILVFLLAPSVDPRAPRGARALAPLLLLCAVAVLANGSIGTIAAARPASTGSRTAPDYVALAKMAAPKYDSATFAKLLQVAVEQGTEAALDRGNVLISQGTLPTYADHDMVHAVGMVALYRYDTPREAFAHCREDHAWGCYHGVIMSYLTAHPDADITALTADCRAQFVGIRTETGSTCEHGIGHALSVTRHNDVHEMLRVCDTLPQDWSWGCWDGGLMENSEQAKSGLLPGYNELSAPLAPCNQIGNKYGNVCYMGQGRVIMTLLHNDVAKSVTACTTADPAFVGLCIEGIGREVDVLTVGDTATSKLRCAAAGTFADLCLFGTLKYERDRPLRSVIPPVCGAMSDAQTRDRCDALFGSRLALEVESAPERARECTVLAEPRAIERCRVAAR